MTVSKLSKASIEPNEIVSFLKKDIQFKEVCQKILAQRVISQAVEERGITVSPEKIQANADQLRLEKRLEKAADTLAWLSDEMITADNWETGICARLLAQELAENLFAKEAEKFFAQTRIDFEQILLYQIIVNDEPLAQELFYQIEEGEISFYQAAHLYDIDEMRRHQCGYEGKIYRWSLKPDVAAVVFSTQLGELIGSIKTEQGYHLLIVEEFIPAELKPETYQEILDRMFKEWLASELNYMIYNQ